MKTFLQIVSETKNKYHLDDELIIFEILYFLSSKVKSKIEFMTLKDSAIDFSPRHFRNFIKQYYVHKKPLAHILGKTSFCGIDLIVAKKILAPRPETELLCEEIIKILKSDDKLNDVLDACCGTGNIGITVKKNVPNVNLSCLDVNTKAIKNTKLNFYNNAINGTLINRDIFKFVKEKHSFDVIVVNPPYVKKDDVTKTLTKYESKISFINSPHPTDFYKTILENIANLIKNQNHFLIAFEFGFDLKSELEKIVLDNNLSIFSRWIKDYSNLDRFLLIYKNN